MFLTVMSVDGPEMGAPLLISLKLLIELLEYTNVTAFAIICMLASDGVLSTAASGDALQVVGCARANGVYCWQLG